MKTLNLFLTGIMVVFAISLSAQDNKATERNDDIPEHISTKFSHEFPQTTDTEWKMEGDSYVVEFTTASGESQKVWYDKAGEKQSEERALSEGKKVPKGLREVLSGKYAGYKVNKITEVKNIGLTSYRVQLEKDGNLKNIILNADGKELE